jgi:dTDP-glucose 4,6-dehydratase
MSSQRVVITGGAGFLGSNLCDAYIARGWDVVCIDNEASGRQQNIQHLLAHSGFTYLKQDVVQGIQVDGPVDVVLHMASLASPPFYKNYPIETLLVGSAGTHRCLDLAAEKGARLIFASTSEVYGDPAISPQHEEYWGNVNCIGPRSMYDESKRYGEALVTAHRAALGTNTGIIRIFNTFGPRMRPDDGRVVTAFLTQLLRNQPLTIHGDGSQTRSFCYVADLIRGIMLMADSDHSGPINLGNPYGEMSIRELAERLSALFGRPFVAGPPAPPQDENDPKRRCPDITLAREVLGWEPKTSFEDGMQATRDWLRSQLNLDA